MKSTIITMYERLFILIISFLFLIDTSLSFRNFLTRPRSIAFQAIPTDLSSLDTINELTRYNSIYNYNEVLTPDNSIRSLEGGLNLGRILWTFNLFNGLGGITDVNGTLSPADLTLYILGNITTNTDSNNNDSVWYKDFLDGYLFTLPPSIELLRLSIFAFLGWEFNGLLIEAFGGDTFWGWSTAGALFIPSGLFSLARTKRVTREFAMIEV